MATFPDLAAIREEIFKNGNAKRILIRIKTKRLDSRDYRTSVYSLVSEIFPNWEHDHRILFLAIEVWSERTFIAIDINDKDYDFATAHETKTIFPVYVLRQLKRRQDWALIRWPREDGHLSERLAHLHNVNGWDATTPFLVNHNELDTYANPRWLRR